MLAIEQSPQVKTKDNTLVGKLSELLAEPFGITDSVLISRTTKVNRYFDVFVHQLDDIKDNPVNGAILAHEAVTNLVNGIKLIRDTRENNVLFDRLFGYWQQASEGERHLWRHHGKLFPYNSEDFLMLGRRGAMAKVPVALYADASQNNSPVSDLEKGIEEAGAAVQLCDDIFDWKTDLEAGIYTHPIVLAHQESQSLDKAGIERALFSPRVFSTLANIVSHYLTSAKTSFDQASAKKLATYIQQMNESIVNLTKYSNELEQKGIHNNLYERMKEKANPLVLSH